MNPTWYEKKVVAIKIKRHGNAKPRCSTCGKRMGGAIRTIESSWRHRDAFRTMCVLEGPVRIGRCAVHGERHEAVPWAAPRAWHTKEFEEAVGWMVQVANKTATSTFYRLAWRTVGSIVTRIVERKLPGDILDGLTAIGVDETSYKRGHHYLTVVSCSRLVASSGSQTARPRQRSASSTRRSGPRDAASSTWSPWIWEPPIARLRRSGCRTPTSSAIASTL